MKIKKLALDSFGKFQNFTIDLAEGFNVIYGHNESGKSTLMAFIMMMFYGYSGRKQSVADNPRTKYLPWGGQKMSGKIYFESEGVAYRLERSFGKSNKTDKIKVYQEHTGTEVQIKSSPGKHFFHVNGDTFRQSLFIFTNQSVIVSSDIAKDEITERLLNLVTTGSEDTSYDEAKKEIEEAKQTILSKNKKKGKLAEAQHAIKELKENLMQAYEDEKEKKQVQSKIAHLKENAHEIFTEKDELEKALESRRLMDQSEVLSQAVDRTEKAVELEEEINALSNQLKTEDGLIEKSVILSYQNQVSEIKNLQKEEEAIRLEMMELERKLTELDAEDREEIPPGLTQELKSNEEALSSLEKQIEETNKRIEEAARYQKEVDKADQLTQQYEEKETDLQQLQEEFQQIEEKYKIQLEQVEEEEEAHLVLARDLEAIENRKKDLEQYIQEEEKEFNYQTDSFRLQHQTKLDYINDFEDIMNQKTSDRQPKNKPLLIAGVALTLAGVGLGLVNPYLYLLAALGLILAFLSYRQSGAPQKIEHSDLEERVKKLNEEVALAEKEYRRQQEDYELKEEENRQLLEALEEDIGKLQTESQEALRTVERDKEYLFDLEKNFSKTENSQQDQSNELKYLEEQLNAAHKELNAYPDEIKDIDMKEEASHLQEMQEKIDGLNERKDAVLDQYAVEDLYDLTRLENKIQTTKKELGDCRANLEKKSRHQKTIHKQEKDKRLDLFNKLSVFEKIENLQDAQDLVSRLDDKREQLSQLQVQAQTEKANQSELEKSYSLDELKEQREDIEKQLKDVNLTSETTEELESQLDQVTDRLHEIDKEISKTETEVIERFRDKANVSQIESELAHYQGKERKWQGIYEDLERSEKYLEEAFEEMQTGFSPIVNQKTSEIFNKLTGGKYSEVKVSKDFDVSIEDHETQDLKLWEYMSTGTIEQIYLSLRLAISEIIAEEEGHLPLFLDDIFAQYDDERARNGLRMLAELSKQAGDHQILLFTCHHRITEWGREVEDITVNQQLINNQ